MIILVLLSPRFSGQKSIKRTTCLRGCDFKSYLYWFNIVWVNSIAYFTWRQHDIWWLNLIKKLHQTLSAKYEYDTITRWDFLKIEDIKACVIFITIYTKPLFLTLALIISEFTLPLLIVRKVLGLVLAQPIYWIT